MPLSIEDLEDYLQGKGVPLERLKSKCSDEHLLTISCDVDDWETQAPHFGLDAGDVKAIKREHGEEAARRHAMLVKWKRINGFKATYSELMSIFLKTRSGELAQKVCDVLAESENDQQIARSHQSTQSPEGLAGKCGPDGGQVDGELMQKIHTLEESVMDKDKKIENLQQVVRKRDEMIKHFQSQSQEKEEQLKDREKEVGEREGDIERHQSQLHQKEREVEEREKEAGERERDIELRQSQLHRKEREVEEREKEVGEREEDIERCQSRLQQKEKEVEEREKEIEERQGDIERRQSQLQKKEVEVKEKEEEVREKREQLDAQLQQKDIAVKEREKAFKSIHQLRHASTLLQMVTVNQKKQIVVKWSNSSDRPCAMQENTTAEHRVQSASKATTSMVGRWLWPKKAVPQDFNVAVDNKSSSQCEISYTAHRRGQYKLFVQENVVDSPFIVTVYPDPTQLGSPVVFQKDLNVPFGIAINSCGEMIVTEFSSHQVSFFNNKGQRVTTFGSHGTSPEEMKHPAGIAVDVIDNMYVTSEHKLQKVSKSEMSSKLTLIKCVGCKGSKEGEFDDPRGITVHRNQVYVCDKNNHRIQVFDLDLNFIQTIGELSNGTNQPHDVAFDTEGNMYVVEEENERVQVMDNNGKFRVFCQGREGELETPTAIHIVDKYVYVSDLRRNCIVVYETSGRYVTSFGSYGHEEGMFSHPRGVTTCANGFVYVCDCNNNRVQKF